MNAFSQWFDLSTCWTLQMHCNIVFHEMNNNDKKKGENSTKSTRICHLNGLRLLNYTRETSGQPRWPMPITMSWSRNHILSQHPKHIRPFSHLYTRYLQMNVIFGKPKQLNIRFVLSILFLFPFLFLWLLLLFSWRHICTILVEIFRNFE